MCESYEGIITHRLQIPSPLVGCFLLLVRPLGPKLSAGSWIPPPFPKKEKKKGNRRSILKLVHGTVVGSEIKPFTPLVLHTAESVVLLAGRDVTRSYWKMSPAYGGREAGNEHRHSINCNSAQKKKCARFHKTAWAEESFAERDYKMHVTLVPIPLAFTRENRIQNSE